MQYLALRFPEKVQRISLFYMDHGGVGVLIKHLLDKVLILILPYSSYQGVDCVYYWLICDMSLEGLLC